VTFGIYTNNGTLTPNISSKCKKYMTTYCKEMFIETNLQWGFNNSKDIATIIKKQRAIENVDNEILHHIDGCLLEHNTDDVVKLLQKIIENNGLCGKYLKRKLVIKKYI